MVVVYKTGLVAKEGGQMGGQMGGQIGGQIGNKDYDITDRQSEVLILIQENKKISRKKIAEKLGIAASAVQKHTDALQAKGIIERLGKTRGFWKVNL